MKGKMLSMQAMSNKARLEAVLAGKQPDVPPHFEMLFQLEEEAFGLKSLSGEELQRAGEAEREKDLDTQVEIRSRLIEEYGWAAVQGPTRLLKRELGHKALVFDFNGRGTFWMPPGDQIMDFVICMFERPEEMHESARKKCAASILLAKQQQDEGVDFIIINSDYAFNSGPFISPGHFKEFVAPYLAEI
ncbi:MAG: uroporphyrinogen decarboxylase family protein, partial [bacterium]|nr:uroporphyrinogen decarboxylase family protein [bacterium]